MAPERAGTLRAFRGIAQQLFDHVALDETYDAEVDGAHKMLLGQDHYDPDIHFPKLLTLVKAS